MNGQFTIEIPSEYIFNAEKYEEKQRKIVQVPIQVIIEKFVEV